MITKNESNTSVRRSLQERAEQIFNFIEKQNKAFPKSKLKEIGLNPNSAENWLTLIEYIQNQPRIRLVSAEKNTLVEKVEGKYQAMIRRVVIDETLPFEAREILLRNYLPSLYTREKLEIERKKSFEDVEFPRTKEELKKFVRTNNLEIKDEENVEELLVTVKNWFDSFIGIKDR